MARTCEVEDLTGRRFGRRVVLGMELKRKYPWGSAIYWRVLCDCGRVSIVTRSGVTKSPECRTCSNKQVLRQLGKTGWSKCREYSIYWGILKRCYDTRCPSYHNYGGRGIRMCDEWRQSFRAFFADIGPRPSAQHTLDRINNDGNYEPGNVRWATRREQAFNRRNTILLTLAGETKNLAEWSAITGLTPATIRGRLTIGWSHEDALTTPKGCIRKHLQR